MVVTNVYVIGAFATIGGGLFGFDISSMSGVLNNPAYLDYFGQPNSTTQGGIVASMPGGSLVGALLSSFISDKLGRKPSVIVAAAIWVVGCTLQCASQNIGMLVLGRFISGVSVGISSSIVPVYQAEIAPPAIRGRIVSLQQWAITWGILIQYFIQLGCSYINGNASFRLPWGLQMIPGIILGLGMTFFPESPRWLADHDKWDQCLQTLADLHGNGEQTELVQLEYNEIKEAVSFERTQAARSWGELLAPSLAKRVFMGVSLQAWSQLTGMNVMMYYIVYVFQGAGITGQHGTLIASSIQYVLNVAFTVPAILYMDKWGRRPTLLIGSALMAFWLFLVGGIMGGFGQPGQVSGTTTWLISGHHSASNAVIACSYLFVSSFAITWGPCSWTYPSEIYPLRVRAKAVSLATAGNWAFNFALAYAVPPALNSISWKTYFIFAVFNVAAGIHIFLQFPETTSRTLEEIEAIFIEAETKWPWQISRDVGKRNVKEVIEAVKADEKIAAIDGSSIEKA